MGRRPGRISFLNALMYLARPLSWVWPSRSLRAPEIIWLKICPTKQRHKECPAIRTDQQRQSKSEIEHPETASDPSLLTPFPALFFHPLIVSSPQFLRVRFKIGLPTISANPSLTLPGPDLQGYFARPLTPELIAVPIPEFDPPEIFGRRRFSRPATEDKPPIAQGVSRPASRGESDMPASFWQLLWEILSPPPRVEELVEAKFPGKLYPFQIDGIKRLIEKEQFILADEMGTGKTVQTCVALSLLVRLGRVRQALIVCPKSALSVWDNHLRQWTPEVAINDHLQYAFGNRAIAQDTRPRAWIVPYSRLSTIDAALHLNRPWDLVVLDEVHEIRNPLTKKYKTLQMITRATRYRWGLSGTPLQNRLEELTAIFSIIRPSLQLRAENMPPAQVREAIRPYLRRVCRKDVLPDLPTKTRQEIWLELDEKQRHDYQAILGRFQTDSKSTRVTFTHIWQVLTELKKICNFSHDSRTSPKLEKLLELTQEIIGQNQKVVVFTHFREFGTDRLEPYLRPFGLALMHGGCTDVQRAEAVERFQTDPQCRVFLATVHTGGFGLTLTAANNVIHFDHWWNPAVAWQAEDRVYRIGQKRPVTVYEFWVRNTVEERIRQILEHKGLLHHEVIERLSEKDFRKLFTLSDLMSLLQSEFSLTLSS